MIAPNSTAGRANRVTSVTARSEFLYISWLPSRTYAWVAPAYTPRWSVRVISSSSPRTWR
jgi:hypothetical protein